MDLLPRDVQLIVYRYLHDDLHNKVQQQFSKIYVPKWNDIRKCYFFRGYCIANYRSRTDHVMFIYDIKRQINEFTIYDSVTTSRGSKNGSLVRIPKKYW